MMVGVIDSDGTTESGTADASTAAASKPGYSAERVSPSRFSLVFGWLEVVLSSSGRARAASWH